MNERISAKIANGGIIAAAMVVGIHVCRAEQNGSLLWWWDQLTHRGVFVVAVPFFFVCSGYFLCRHYVGVRDGHGAGGDSLLEVWRGEMWKRVKSLLVPFLIWSVIGLCVFEVLPVRIAANVLHGRDLLSNVPEGWRFWAHAFGVYPYNYPLNSPLWYVRSLLIFAILSPMLFKLMKKWGARICIVTYILWVLLGTKMGIERRMDLIFFYCVSLRGLFFFSIGCAVAQAGNCKFPQGLILRCPKFAVGCLVAGLGLVVLRTWLEVESGQMIIPWAPLFEPLLLVLFWEVVPSCQLPRWLTCAAFPIYLIHVILWKGIGKFCALSGCLMPQFMKVETIGDWWVKWAVGFGGSLLVSLGLRRLFPRTASVLFGGRMSYHG